MIEWGKASLNHLDLIILLSRSSFRFKIKVDKISLIQYILKSLNCTISSRALLTRKARGLSYLLSPVRPKLVEVFMDH
jgi:hypothetical protein